MANEQELEYLDVETIEIPLEDGTTMECAIIDEFEMDDQGYMILSPIENDEIQDEYFAYRYRVDGDDIVLDYIDDEEELHMVQIVYETILEEDDYAEE